MSTSKWEPDGQLAWCWLQHGGAALMLQQADEKDAPYERDNNKLAWLDACGIIGIAGTSHLGLHHNTCTGVSLL